MWLEGPAGAALPDRDSLQADACAPSYRYDSHTRLVLESKADGMRSRSPLLSADSALTQSFDKGLGSWQLCREVCGV
jgi:hypothetical protein